MILVVVVSEGLVNNKNNKFYFKILDSVFTEFVSQPEMRAL